MGLEQTVAFPGGVRPTWPAVRDLLERRNFPVQVRMIDSELAFPDEAPPETWSELRVGCAAGMVTLRCQADGIAFIVWGSAGPELVRARNALMWAFAEAGGGRILTAEEEQNAAEFLRSAKLPEKFLR